MYVLPALPAEDKKNESRLESRESIQFTIHSKPVRYSVQMLAGHKNHRDATFILMQFFSYSSDEEDKEWGEMVDNYQTYQVKL